MKSKIQKRFNKKLNLKVNVKWHKQNIDSKKYKNLRYEDLNLKKRNQN